MPCMDFSKSGRSLMLPLIRVTFPFLVAQSRFLETPRLKLSRATISPTPSLTKRSQMEDPTRPAAPVTRTFVPFNSMTSPRLFDLGTSDLVQAFPNGLRHLIHLGLGHLGEKGQR